MLGWIIRSGRSVFCNLFITVVSKIYNLKNISMVGWILSKG